TFAPESSVTSRTSPRDRKPRSEWMNLATAVILGVRRGDARGQLGRLTNSGRHVVIRPRRAVVRAACLKVAPFDGRLIELAFLELRAQESCGNDLGTAEGALGEHDVAECAILNDRV